MTESELESGQVSPEAEETPTPAVPSAPSGDEQTSEAPTDDVSALRQEIADLKESVADQIARGLQGHKDRRIARLEERLETLIEAQAPQPEPSPEPVVGATETAVESRMVRFARRILGNEGIDSAEGSDYEQWVKSYRFVSEDRFYDDLEAWVDQTKTKAARQEAPGPASVSTPASSAATISEDVDELAAELYRLQRPGPNEPGLTHPDNIARRKEISDRLRQIGPSGKVIGGQFVPD
jgi:hypothetical protein